jgi:Ca2+-binding RTX toxin-like protein
LERHPPISISAIPSQPIRRRRRDDLLQGRGGDDTLIGGLGVDTLIGGLGIDNLISDLLDSLEE